MFGWFKKDKQTSPSTNTNILGRDFLFDAEEKQFMSEEDAVESWKNFIKDDCLQNGASKAEALKIAKEYEIDFKQGIKDRKNGWKDIIRDAEYVIKDSKKQFEKNSDSEYWKERFSSDLAQQEALINNAQSRINSGDHTSDLLFELNKYINKMDADELVEYWNKDFY